MKDYEAMESREMLEDTLDDLETKLLSATQKIEKLKAQLKVAESCLELIAKEYTCFPKTNAADCLEEIAALAKMKDGEIESPSKEGN